MILWLHWERHARFLDLCDGEELVGSIETRRHGKAPTTYHWTALDATPSRQSWGMTESLDEAKRRLCDYVLTAHGFTRG